MNGEVFGTDPAPLCPNTALYAGWYNYGRYNDAFSWAVGRETTGLPQRSHAFVLCGIWGGIPCQERVPHCRRCDTVMFGQPGDFIERRHP